MKVKRPPCGICGGVIPKSLLSDRDVQAEKEYVKEHGGKFRRFYCGMVCFDKARSEEGNS